MSKKSIFGIRSLSLTSRPSRTSRTSRTPVGTLKSIFGIRSLSLTFRALGKNLTRGLALLALLAAPAAAGAAAGAKPLPKGGPADAFAGLVAALGRGDVKAAETFLDPALDPEARAGFLDKTQAKVNAGALGKLVPRGEEKAPGETWRFLGVPGKKEFLLVALGETGLVHGILPVASDRARRFRVTLPAGADPEAVAAILRARFAAFRMARALVTARPGAAEITLAGLESGDLPLLLLSARGEFGLHRIVPKGKRLPFLKVYGMAERAPEAVDETPILGSGHVRRVTLAWSTTNLPQLKFECTPEGTRRLVRFHRECEKPDETSCAFALDGKIVDRIGVTRSFLGGAFWLTGFYKAEDAEFVRALVSAPPLPAGLKAEEVAGF